MFSFISRIWSSPQDWYFLIFLTMCAWSHKLWIIPTNNANLKIYVIFKWDHQTWIKSPLREVTRIAWSNLRCERLMVIRMMYLALRNVSLANFILVSVMASVHVHARVQGQPLDARHVCQSFNCSNWVTFIKWTKCTCYLFKMKRAFSEFAGPRRRNARPLMLDNSNSCLILDLLPGSRDIAMVSSAPSSPAPRDRRLIVRELIKGSG